MGAPDGGARRGDASTPASDGDLAPSPDLTIPRDASLAIDFAGADEASLAIATRLVFATQPVNGPAGALGTIRVRAVDVDGALVPTATGTVRLHLTGGPAGASLDGTIERPLIDGEARFDDLRVGRLGAGYRLGAELDLLAPAESAPFDRWGSRLAFDALPTQVLTGTYALRPTVRVVDEENNVDAGYTGTVSLSWGQSSRPAVLSGSTTLALVNGVAQFSWLGVDRWGTRSLRAEVDGLPAVESTPFRATCASLRFAVQPSDIVAGQVMTPAPAIECVDAAGDPDGDDASPINGGLTCPSQPERFAFVMQSGKHSFDGLTFSRVGIACRMYFWNETLSLSSGASDPFSVSPAEPSALRLLPPPPRKPVGADIPFELVGEVVDGFGNRVPLDGVAVSLDLPAAISGAASAVTSQGQARFSNLLAKTMGAHPVTVHASGFPSADGLIGVGAWGWMPLPAPGFPGRLSVSPSDADDIVLAVADTSYRSKDGGLTWAQQAGSAFVFSPTDANRLYRLGKTGDPNTVTIDRSTDGGATWSSGASTGASATLSPDSFDPDALLVLNNGLYRSTDRGATLARVATAYGEPVWAQSPPERVYTILNLDAYPQPRTDLMRSDDGGASWMSRPFPESQEMSALVVDAGNGDLVYARAWSRSTYRSSLWRTTDAGQTWTDVTSMFPSETTSIFTHPVDAGTLFAQWSPNVSVRQTLRSLDGGATWSPWGDYPGTIPIFARSNPQVIYSVEQDGILRTRTGGLP